MDSWNQFFIIRKTWMWILHFVLNSMICYWMNEWIKSELCWHRSSLRVGCATSFIEIYKHMVQLVAKMANGSICLKKNLHAESSAIFGYVMTIFKGQNRLYTIWHWIMKTFVVPFILHIYERLVLLVVVVNIIKQFTEKSNSCLMLSTTI